MRLPSQKSRKYQFVEVNPFSKSSSSFGSVSIPQILKSEEYFSYLNKETGSSTIVTNIGGLNYECEGSCYCEDPSEFEISPERRIVTTSSSQILSRGLAVLFSAFSVSMALKIAEETFQEQCENEFSYVCNAENIQSETNQCREKKEEIKTPAEENEAKLYHCIGNCVRTDINFWNSKDGYARSYGYIGDRAFTSSFDQFEFNLIGKKIFGECKDLNLEVVHYWEGQMSVSEVEEDFSVRLLDDFCRQRTFMEKDWFTKREQKKFERVQNMLKDSQLGRIMEIYGTKGKIYEGVNGVAFCSGAYLEVKEMGKSSKENVYEYKGDVKCVKSGFREMEKWVLDKEE